MMARSTSVNFAGVFVSLPNATTRKREAGVGREARGKMTKTSAIKKTEAATNINVHFVALCLKTSGACDGYSTCISAGYWVLTIELSLCLSVHNFQICHHHLYKLDFKNIPSHTENK